MAAASSSLDAAWPSRRTPVIDRSGASDRASARKWSSRSWPCLTCRPWPSRVLPEVLSIWTICRGAPMIVASRAAPASAAELRDVPSMPTTTGAAACPGPRRRRITINGQGEDPARARQTDPATCPSTPPRPRLLTTRRRASPGRVAQHRRRESCFHDPFDVGIGSGGGAGGHSFAAAPSAGTGAADAGPVCADCAAVRAAARDARARSTPSARIASAECRSPLPSTPLTGPSFLVNTGQTQAWTTRIL